MPLDPTTLPLRRLVLAYLLTAVVFLAMDAVWLFSTATSLYRPALGHLMAQTVDWPAAGTAAAVFYALYVGGLVYFAVHPALVWRQASTALGRGALLGLLCYATYDLTNQATLRDWPWHITMIDLVWGATVSGVSSWAAAAIVLLTSRRANRTSGR
jgi:uncharacterized membrane protein